MFRTEPSARLPEIDEVEEMSQTEPSARLENDDNNNDNDNYNDKDENMTNPLQDANIVQQNLAEKSKQNDDNEVQYFWVQYQFLHRAHSGTYLKTFLLSTSAGSPSAPSRCCPRRPAPSCSPAAPW